MDVLIPLTQVATDDLLALCDNRPTADLLQVLRDCGWSVSARNVGAGLDLSHPDRGAMTLARDPGRADRLAVLVDGRQVPYRVAMQRARGEA